MYLEITGTYKLFSIVLPCGRKVHLALSHNLENTSIMIILEIKPVWMTHGYKTNNFFVSDFLLKIVSSWVWRRCYRNRRQQNTEAGNLKSFSCFGKFLGKMPKFQTCYLSEINRIWMFYHVSNAFFLVLYKSFFLFVCWKIGKHLIYYT